MNLQSTFGCCVYQNLKYYTLYIMLYEVFISYSSKIIAKAEVTKQSIDMATYDECIFIY